MYCDYFRDFDDDDIYELETQDLPFQCPYRQRVPMPPFVNRPQGSQGKPSSAPPNFIPQEPKAQQFGAAPFAVDQGAIRPCVYRFVYIWPRRREGFWAWLTFVGRKSVSGFRWGRFTWRYFGMSLKDIKSFQCF